MKLVGYAVLFSIVTLSVSLAGFLSNKDFLDTCHSKEYDRQIACSGYIAGVTDSYLSSGQFCIPLRTDPREITLFTKDYVLRTRSVQNAQPVQMVLYALRSRWPCLTREGFGFRFEMR